MNDDKDLSSAIISGVPDGVIAADASGNSILWNAGAEKIFGFLDDDALGSSLDLIIPENLRKQHWEGYRRVMASGETKYGDRLLATPALTKEGTRISIEFSIAVLKDDAGAPCGTAAIVRDVTQKWQKDRELKMRLAELEKRLENGEDRK